MIIFGVIAMVTWDTQPLLTFLSATGFGFCLHEVIAPLNRKDSP